MIRLQACLVYSYQNKHSGIMLTTNKLQQCSFVTRRQRKVIWHSEITPIGVQMYRSQTYLAQGRWMVAVKLIKATSWLCQTNSLHLDSIAQMPWNVLDLPPSTCLRVCVCLHLNHFLHRGLDLFANDLVLFSFFPWLTSLAVLRHFNFHFLFFPLLRAG